MKGTEGWRWEKISLPAEGLGGIWPGPSMDVMSSPSGCGLSKVRGDELGDKHQDKTVSNVKVIT